jgi:membrane fusion protein (multidrug efflux system)
MRIVRQLVILAVLAGIAWGGYEAYQVYFAKEAQTQQRPGSGRPRIVVNVEVVPATVATIEEQIEAVGTTVARRSVAVVPSAAGRLVAINFEPGDEVQRGAELARLDDDIERANLAEAQAKAEEVRRAVERTQSLRRTRTVTEVTLENVLVQQQIALAELERAERRLADRTVVAPFAGVVGLRRVDLGARVNETTMLTTLDDLNEVEIEFSVPETHYGRIAAGQNVVADGTAFPDRSFSGKIVSIDSRVDPVSRAFKVRARVPNPNRTLPAGMFMHLVVVLSAREGLTVPEEAIVVQGSDTFVFTIEDGKAARRSVVLGKRQVGTIEITGGLAEGDQVVVRGVQRLRDGAEVRIVSPGNQASAALRK